MKLERNTSSGLPGVPVMVEALIRRDGTVTGAAEWHYSFVGKNSALPIYDLMSRDDGNLLAATVQKTLSDPGYKEMQPDEVILELITELDNRQGLVCSGVYMTLMSSPETENGDPLCKICYSDLSGFAAAIEDDRKSLAKYRFFMSQRNDIFFEYNTVTGNVVLYKYLNGNSFKIVDTDLDDYIKQIHGKFIGSNPEYERELDELLQHLKKKDRNFSMQIQYIRPDGDKRSARFLGGVPVRNDDLVAGMYVSNNRASDEPYYMTPAARDPGTGLINKRAVSEYVIDMLPTLNGKTAWLIMTDVDDFKNVNDNFGHAFGDEVISYVADSLMSVVGDRGFVGRFGGDEFLAFVYGVPTREGLKNMLKVLNKKLALKFDGKFKLTISQGISAYPVDGENIETLFSKADKALYIAKEKGKNRHIIYDEKLHGGIEGDYMESQAVSYAISRDKKRDFISSLVLGLSRKGIDYLIRSRSVQSDIRTVFDLDGISLLSDSGAEVICSNGKYVLENESREEGISFDFTGFTHVGGDDHTYVLNNTESIKDINPVMYDHLKKLEIGACVVCSAYSGDVPYAVMTFDVFNKIRKWSQSDIDLISIIGNLASTLVMERETNR